MMRRKWVVAGIIAVPAVVLAVLLVVKYVRVQVRILEAGDRFVFRSSRGKYEIQVKERDEKERRLVLVGKAWERERFYDLEMVWDYGGRFLEIREVVAQAARLEDCTIRRRERGFFLFPIKWVRGAMRRFSFRAECEWEGSVLLVDVMDWEKKRRRVVTPAGEFEVFRVIHRVYFPMQEELAGRGDFLFAPQLGFPVKMEITIEQDHYAFTLEQYHLSQGR